MSGELNDDDIDLWHNTWPVCPHCGYTDQDAWELDLGSGMGEEGSDDIKCQSCGKDFHCERGVDIWYTTSRITPPPVALEETNQ